MTALLELYGLDAGKAAALMRIASNAVQPADFAAECRRIVTAMKGHEAHRALDLLTNEVLRSLGFGEGIDVFEAAVAHWHQSADPYPYTGPCPDCQRSDAA